MVYPRFSPHESAASSVALVLSSYDVPKVIGIRYSRNPGYPVVWSGLAAMTVGLAAAFYFPARRVWIRIDAAGNQFELRAESSRGLGRGAMWLREVQEGIEATLRGGR
jgi:cytochrome c biogenesis protein ResB